MSRISAVILARNEETNIVNCLKSVGWCDEIVFVDMESDDNTVGLAKLYTEKIYHHPRIDAFDIAKAYGVKKASGEWVLIVDADEMIPLSLANTLRGLSCRKDVDIVEIPFRHYIMGACIEHSGWGFTPLPRFFRRDKIEFRETIHDYMHPNDESLVFRLEFKEENCIYHFNYIDSSHFIEKMNRYTTVEAKHLCDKKVEFSFRHLVVASLRQFGWRYFKLKGYRDGARGFFLSLMMAFYRALVYMKLWERYEYPDSSVSDDYEKIKRRVLSEWEGC